ncbi:MAG: hypothetical protein Q7K33_00325 [Candidatus Berkelbacteria bacterium]|nr:hypothetical protein [Candidatus Berkelbacteria bacterium]
MNRVRFLISPLVWMLLWSGTSLAQTPDKDDQEVLTAYKELLELAKTGGYDGHKDEHGKLLPGLKTMQFVISFGEPPRLTEARLANIKELSELIYKLQQQPALKGFLDYEEPKIISRETGGIKIEAGVSTPKGVMIPSTIKWTWWMKKGLDGWRIFATSIDIVPATGFRLRSEP